MNPPSALHGAMSKERKPFTYTPGGLDLSEIKSERMAQRLMRNAMNQGVPEKPVQTLKSPPVMPSNALPNFNCLPVQVFPTFALPANPKSLLRTRSNPDAPKEQSNNVPKLNADNTSNASIYKSVNNPPTFMINNSMENNKQSSYYDIKDKPNEYSFRLPDDENDARKFLLTNKQLHSDLQYNKVQSKQANEKHDTTNYWSDEEKQNDNKKDISFTSESNKAIPVMLNILPLQKKADSDDEKKEVKVVKQQTNTKNEVEHNGDTEAEIVIKLPSKKSAAKTETSVDIVKKILPDGTVEEVKTTTTKTTVDGRTEITTKTETKTIPKAVASSEEFEEEQEEETEEIVQVNGEDDENNCEVDQSVEKNKEVNEEELSQISKKQNGHIIVSEEKTEKNTVKKVIVSTEQESEEEIEEEEEVEDVEEEEEADAEDVGTEEVVILNKVSTVQSNDCKAEDEKEVVNQKNNIEEDIKEQEVENNEEIVENEETVEKEESENEEEQDENQNENQVEEVVQEVENIEEKEVSESIVESETDLIQKSEEDDEKDHKQVEENQDEMKQNEKAANNETVSVPDAQVDLSSNEVKSNDDISLEVKQNGNIENVPLNISSTIPLESKDQTKGHERKEEIIIKTSLEYEPKIGFLREPSVPLEKVEDVEIKPIGPAQEIFKKSHTEIITTTTDKPIGASTQTEFNRIENIVTVNRTSKILDHAYEQISQAPTLNTYFTQTTDRVLSSPQPVSKPYQPVFSSEPQSERRHSLLLERLSMERQIPTSEIYHNNYQSTQHREQSPWLQEPQSEVLSVSNVKPSEITKNQQWYQHTRKEDVISSTLAPTVSTPIPQWNKPETQQFVQPQPQVQPQGQPQYQTLSQPQYAPKPEFTPSLTENVSHNKFNNYQNNAYTSYAPKPSWVSSTFEPKPTIPQADHYSTIKKESTENYQSSRQQLSSSYVPPPWEQDSSYVSNNTNYYQPPPPAPSYTPNVNSSWKPKPTSKFSKPAPTSYVPPAPNQSFVKPLTTADPPRLPGRKTYYSEYERRYISVPESTYVPVESKFQAQPDPSPQYYYDNNEPAEIVEPQWRRELREFTEKTQSTQSETTSVRPPWEEDSKYAAPTDYNASAPTSWTQTLRPRSWRERSSEPEYASSKEWPRSNTLGRGRPQSSYVKSNLDTLPRPPRGVSVDRYNPNSYMSPSEHPPVQSQTMNPIIHPKPHHNPSVPAYQARASAEPREQPAYVQPRIHVDTKAPPVQSRSFKYLQWITGTED
ncbi:unnamed protein product [Danaus chrysippus]|uniref:(African queen) hypothetical protein n=1 Tax=Danaus chrysippus TaxID=151541 RepID=A0A8J2QST4_9NEOP|nr:unnamed protein product [Danaus chrysippus]